MTKIKAFFKDTILGTLGLLPILLLYFLYNWLVKIIDRIIEPTKSFMPDFIGKSDVLTFVLLMGILVVVLFVIGLLMRTSIGKWVHGQIEKRILMPFAPGYRFIVKSVKPFMPNNKTSPFKHAAILYPFGSDFFVIGFVTDEHKAILEDEFSSDTIVSVFIPTAPIPSSGQVYNGPASQIKILEGVSIDDSLTPIISCGVGMSGLLEKHELAKKKRLESEGQ